MRYEERPSWNFTDIHPEIDSRIKNKVVNPEKRFSTKCHNLGVNHWFFALRAGSVNLGYENLAVTHGDSVDAPSATKDTISCTSNNLLALTELDTRSNFDENILIRLEDNFVSN